MHPPHCSSASPGWSFYLVLMIGVIRPLAAYLVRRQRTPQLTLELLGVVVAGALLSAAATDKIGVHPLFGAFLAGVCFPRVPHWQLALRERLDMLVSVLLLPLFFALTGMRTRLDLLNDGAMWLWAGVVLLAAVFGKMGGAALAARWTGQSWRDAIALGALLNTRGLVELVVLNIAYTVGAFTPDALHHVSGDGAGHHHAHRADPHPPRHSRHRQEATWLRAGLGELTPVSLAKNSFSNSS